MGTYILTSMFPHGFNDTISKQLREKISKRERFAFVASEFELLHEKTDHYFCLFRDMFQAIGIDFKEACVVDGRMSPKEMQIAVTIADVVWLSGGNTPVEFGYLQKYGLADVIRQHTGVIIGMSAGSVNMAEIAICTISCGHSRQEIYSGLGCVPISVEPHFIREKVAAEVLELSEQYDIYGLCDDSVIIYTEENMEIYGETYLLSGGSVKLLKEGKRRR